MTQQDLVIYQGDDYVATVAIAEADGSPADLTGYTATAQIRRKPADAAPVTVEFLAAVQSPNVLLALTHDQTVALSGSYVWDLQLASAGGAITTVLAGKVKVTQEVTRPEAAAQVGA